MIARLPAARRRLPVVLAFALLALPGRAGADTVTVLGIEAIDAPVAEAATLASALRRALRERADVRFVTARDFMELKFIFGCRNPTTLAACLVPAARSLDADRFIVGTIAGASLRVRLQIVDAHRGRLLHSVEDSIGGSEVDRAEAARRWIDALVGPRRGGEARASSSGPRRTALILGGIALGLAAASGGVAFYTWRRYSTLEVQATNDLDQIYRANPAQRRTDAAWFEKASCDPPADLPRGSLVEGYIDHCREGTSLANATTGLLAGAGVLGAIAAGSFLYAGLRGPDAPRTTAPQITSIVPWLLPGGGGLATAVEF